MQINIRVDEPGANRQRLRAISQDLRTALGQIRNLDVQFARADPEYDHKDPKGVAEFIPGVLTVSVGIAASISRISRVLEAWITRDRYKDIHLENTKTGEVLHLKGLPLEEITQILDRWAREEENNE